MLHKCYCGPVGKYLGHMLYELFAPRGLSSHKSAPKCTFARCSRLCAVLPPPLPALTPFLGTPWLALLHVLYRISCRMSGSVARAEPRLGLTEKSRPGHPWRLWAAAGLWLQASGSGPSCSESVQLCGKWKPWYLKHTYSPALDKAASLLGEEGN